MSGAVGRRPRIQKAFRLKPHRSATLSKDPLFVEKVRNIVSLYPLGAGRRREKPGAGPCATVAGVPDKRSGEPTSATARLARRGAPSSAWRRTHERNGATSLFAAVAAGKVIGKCPQRGISQVPQLHVSPDIHMDSYAIRKTEAAGSPSARAGMSTTPRRPPRGQVERFFGLLTEKQPRRGVHRSTADLERAAVNDDPKPFRWTGGRNSDSTVLPTNAGNRLGSGHKCTNFGIRTQGIYA